MSNSAASDGGGGGDAENTAPCPICLEAMVFGVVSLGCGHLFHEMCLTGAALRHCALCRSPVRPDKIKNAGAVGGARSPSGTFQDNWAARSMQPPGLVPALTQQQRQLWRQHGPQRAQQAQQQAQQQARQQRQSHASEQAQQAQQQQQQQAPQQAQHLQHWQAPQQQHPLRLFPQLLVHVPPPVTSAMPAELLAELAAWQATAQAAPPTPCSSRGSSSRTARDIPADESAALLEGITRQLDAAATAASSCVRPQVELDRQRAAQQPQQAQQAQRSQRAQQAPASTWSFCIDVSSSMGSSRAWQPSAVSRLCFALATLACVVDTRVADGEWVQVTCFDFELAPIKRWFRKPASFDKAAFLAVCTWAVRHSGLRRWGTRLCHAVRHVVCDQAAHACTLSDDASSSSSGGSDGSDGAGAGIDVAAGAGAAAGAPCRPLHSFVLLTDGDADDGSAGFEAAAALMRDPPFAGGGFRALLMHIDHRPGRSRNWLRRLSRSADGTRLPYVDVLQLTLPARLNLTSLSAPPHTAAGATAARASGSGGSGGVLPPRPGVQGAAPGRGAGQLPAVEEEGGAEENDSLPVRAMSRAIHAFSALTLGSAPSRRIDLHCMVIDAATI